MKKVLLAVALVITMGFGAKAQIGVTDAFFNDWEQSRAFDMTIVLPGLPGEHGLEDNVSAPLGSGLFILGALGAGYALRKKRD